jgi:hypothetical protein
MYDINIADLPKEMFMKKYPEIKIRAGLEFYIGPLCRN